MDFRDTHHVVAHVFWQNRCIETQTLPIQEKWVLGAGPQCHMALPGYPGSGDLLGVHLNDLLTAPQQELQLNYLEGLLTVHLKVVEKGQEPRVLPVLPLTLSEKFSFGLSLVVTLFISFYMAHFKPTASINDDDLLTEKVRKSSIRFQVAKHSPKPIRHKPHISNSQAPKTHSSKVSSGTNNNSAASTGFLNFLKNQQANSSSDLRQVSKDKGQVMALGTGRQTPGLKNLNAQRNSVGLGNGNGSQRPQGKFTGEGGAGSIGDHQSTSIAINIDPGGVTGNMDRDAIYRTILSAKKALRHCYEKALQRDSSLFGKVLLQWDILSQGQVTRTRILQNSFKGQQVGACIGRVISSLKFPEPPEGQIGRVTFPFVFVSK